MTILVTPDQFDQLRRADDMARGLFGYSYDDSLWRTEVGRILGEDVVRSLPWPEPVQVVVSHHSGATAPDDVT